MAEYKLNMPFRKTTGDKIETYRIKSLDTKTDKVEIEVEKWINGEKWIAIREWNLLFVVTAFACDDFEYI